MDIDVDQLVYVNGMLGMYDRTDRVFIGVKNPFPADYIKAYNLDNLLTIEFGPGSKVEITKLNPQEKLGLETEIGKMDLAKMTAMAQVENKIYDGDF